LALEFAGIGPLEGGAFDLIGTRQFDLIINATSAGLSGAVPELPSSMLTERSCCYDMVYGAEPTPFLRWSADHAAGAVSDGLGMLVEQAAEAFYIWRQLRPETRSVIDQLREAMEAA
jgi:shikimate dehydrogenase